MSDFFPQDTFQNVKLWDFVTHITSVLQKVSFNRLLLLLSLHDRFFPLHLPELFAFSCLFYHCVSGDVWCISHWKRGGQTSSSTGSKAPGWADLPASWLQAEPLCLVSHKAGGLLQGGGNQGIPSRDQWNGGSPGGPRKRRWLCGSAFSSEVLTLPQGFLSVRCLWRWLSSSYSLPLFPRGGCLGIEPEKRPVVFSYLCFQPLGFLGIVLHSLILDGQETYNLY